MVKTPGLSPVKTRLAEAVGRERALEFYEKSIETVESVLEQAGRRTGAEFVPHWAVAEPEGESDPLWSSFETISTGEGGFGRRMFNVYNELLSRYDAGFLLGSDSPQLQPEIIETTISRLESPSRVVIGPSVDGGFYLVGGNQPLGEATWTQVEYSRSDTYREFVDGLAGDLELVELTQAYDVDRLPDLEPVASRLREGSNEAQLELAEWIDNLLENIN